MPARTASSAATAAWEFLLDLVYPPRCGGCDRRGTLFCDDCLLSISVPGGMSPVPGVGKLTSAGLFQGPLRTAIHKLKYDGDTPLARPLGGFLQTALERSAWWEDLRLSSPTIVPVPLHPTKQRARGFNQSELLARELSKREGWPLDKGLARVKKTLSQVGLSAKQRQENVQGAFRWTGGAVPEQVLLVDDVCTTGATLSESVAALAAAGVRQVYVATVARASGHERDDGPRDLV